MIIYFLQYVIIFHIDQTTLKKKNALMFPMYKHSSRFITHNLKYKILNLIKWQVKQQIKCSRVTSCLLTASQCLQCHNTMVSQFNRNTELGRKKVPSEIWPFCCEELPTAWRKRIQHYNSMMCSSSWEPVNLNARI